MLYAIALACAPSTVSITFQFFLPTQNGRIARSQAELSMGIFPSPRNVLRYYSSQSALFGCHKICSLLLYFILYLFVIRSFDNLYLARFHGLQCSLMTFWSHSCTTCSIYFDWDFWKFLSLLRISFKYELHRFSLLPQQPLWLPLVLLAYQMPSE